MSDHVSQMKTDYRELAARIGKLNTFIYCNAMFQRLDDQEKVRMIKQSGFMESYLSVLESRIWCGQSGNLRLTTDLERRNKINWRVKYWGELNEEAGEWCRTDLMDETTAENIAEILRKSYDKVEVYYDSDRQ